MGIFTYFKIGVLAGIIIAAGLLVWNYQGMKIKLQEAITKKDVAEAKLLVAEKTIKIFKEWADAEKIIDSTDDPDLIEYFRTGVFPDHSKAGDRPAPVPGETPPGVDEKRQE